MMKKYFWKIAPLFVGGLVSHSNVALADTFPSFNYNYSTGQKTITGSAVDPDYPSTAVRLTFWIGGVGTTVYASGGNFTYTIPSQFYDGNSHAVDIYVMNIKDDGTSPGTADNRTKYSTSIKVTPNRAPVANNDSHSANEDGSRTVNVLGNDSDPDGDSIYVSSVGSPSHGSAVKSGSNVLYTPSSNYCGSDSFSYTISDGKGLTDSATVSMTVTCVNDAPIAKNDSHSVNEDGSRTVNVLGNDSDPDGDSIYVSSVGSPSHGSAVKSGSNVVYTPSSNYCGSDSFSYTISDGKGLTDSATVSMTVTCINDAPVITGQKPLSVNEDSSITLSASNFYISDPDSSSFTLAVHPGSNYSVSGTTVTPSANYSGSLSVPVSISDGQYSDDYTASITVNAMNDKPVGSVDTYDGINKKGKITGWCKDEVVNRVSIWHDANANGSINTADGDTHLGYLYCNQSRSDGYSGYGFEFTIPTSFKGGASETYFITAMDYDLNGSQVPAPGNYTLIGTPTIDYAFESPNISDIVFNPQSPSTITVGNTINVAVSINDPDNQYQNARILVNGSQIATGLSASWSPDVSGAYSITAEITSINGQIADTETRSYTVTVEAPVNNSPTGQVNTYANDGLITGTCSDDAIHKVRIWLDANKDSQINVADGDKSLGDASCDQNNGGYFSFSIPAEYHGSEQNYRVIVLDYDAESNLVAGSYTDLGYHLINVTITNAIPTVDILSPIGTISHLLATPLTLQATSSDTDGSIVKVEFYIDDVKVSIDEDSVDGVYTGQWSTPPLGNHILKAVAYDDDGDFAQDTEAFNISNALPEISIVSGYYPNTNAIVQLNPTDKLVIAASDDGYVNSVNVTNTVTGENSTATLVGSYWEVELSNLASSPGLYSLNVTATDDLGATNTLTINEKFNVCTGNGRPSPLNPKEFGAGFSSTDTDAFQAMLACADSTNAVTLVFEANKQYKLNQPFEITFPNITIQGNYAELIQSELFVKSGKSLSDYQTDSGDLFSDIVDIAPLLKFTNNQSVNISNLNGTFAPSERADEWWSLWLSQDFSGGSEDESKAKRNDAFVYLYNVKAITLDSINANKFVKGIYIDKTHQYSISNIEFTGIMDELDKFIGLTKHYVIHEKDVYAPLDYVMQSKIPTSLSDPVKAKEQAAYDQCVNDYPETHNENCKDKKAELDKVKLPFNYEGSAVHKQLEELTNRERWANFRYMDTIDGITTLENRICPVYGREFVTKDKSKTYHFYRCRTGGNYNVAVYIVGINQACSENGCRIVDNIKTKHSGAAIVTGGTQQDIQVKNVTCGKEVIDPDNQIVHWDNCVYLSSSYNSYVENTTAYNLLGAVVKVRGAKGVVNGVHGNNVRLSVVMESTTSPTECKHNNSNTCGNIDEAEIKNIDATDNRVGLVLLQKNQGDGELVSLTIDPDFSATKIGDSSHSLVTNQYYDVKVTDCKNAASEQTFTLTNNIGLVVNNDQTKEKTCVWNK
ncbi:tandem-95 repeat protein [Paraneptunicella aestuarii]|uniref:Ig-like domain-containing protein n=1 Tax=Paraneptunicella aestuarii TaxID=2831148 RepID=UPI001E2C14A3|nr:tandem-95 repeat protein [Paraneptunicella aestuarii]UAA38206.1 tandem-95 repeat protein [Paraneptunicella aestuarii]